MNIYLNRCTFSFERLTFTKCTILSISACDNCFERSVVESNVGTTSNSRSVVDFSVVDISPSLKVWTQIYRTQGYLQNNI